MSELSPVRAASVVDSQETQNQGDPNEKAVVLYRPPLSLSQLAQSFMRDAPLSKITRHVCELIGYSKGLDEVIVAEGVSSDADLKVAIYARDTGLAVKMGSSGHIIPDLPQEKMRELWREERALVGKPLENLDVDFMDDEGDSSHLWVNTATTVDEMLDDAQATVGGFKNLVREAAAEGHGEAYFGPGDIYATKGRGSLEGKVKRILEATKNEREPDEALDGEALEAKKQEQVAEALSGVEDAVRGTIFFGSVEEMRAGIDAFQRKAAAMGMEVVYIDTWTRDALQSGYVDVKAKFVMNVPGKEGGKIVGELQFHVVHIVSNAPDCTKTREHGIYETIRMAAVEGTLKPEDEDMLRRASLLLYTAAIYQARPPEQKRTNSPQVQEVSVNDDELPEAFKQCLRKKGSNSSMPPSLASQVDDEDGLSSHGSSSSVTSFDDSSTGNGSLPSLLGDEQDN